MSRRKWRKGVYHTTTHLAVVLLLLILFVSAAYFFVIPEPQDAPQQTRVLNELQAYREIWESRRPLSFRYVVDRTCFCLQEHIEPYVATEQRGYRSAEYPSQIRTRSGNFLTTPPQPVWIDDLFGFIEKAVLEDDKVEVGYDARFGYPRLIDISRGHKARDANDRYEVRDFEVLEYD